MTVKIDGSNGLLQNYDYQTPLTGFTYTFTTYITLFMVPAGTLATGTVTMSATPVDGTMVTITSTQQITALTINANTGQSIIGGGAVQLNANTSRTYMYRLANTTWYLTNVAAGNVVTSAVAGTGVSVSSATGAVTFTNTGVTSAVAGNGITVSGATGAVTISQDFYTGSTAQNTSYPIGSYLVPSSTNLTYNINASVTMYCPPNAALFYIYAGANGGSGSSALSGTWRVRGNIPGACQPNPLVQRTA